MLSSKLEVSSSSSLKNQQIEALQKQMDVDISNFIPLQGSFRAYAEETFELDKEIDKFLGNDKKVLLLLGDSGSGKSLYTQQLAQRLLKENAKYLPLWIGLASVKQVDKAVEETLKGYGCQDPASLKTTQPFLFILDGYDEIKQLKNLYASNKLSEWQGKIIITCRREYLYSVDNYRSLFMPYEGQKPLPWAYSEIVVAPFSSNQIEAFCRQLIKQGATNWQWEQYQEAIEAIPGLKELITNPFMLKLAVEVLPSIYSDSQKSEESKFITRARLYDAFIEQWFDRQEVKLKEARQIKGEDNIKPEFWAYAKGIASTMHKEGVTQIQYDPNESSLLEETESPWQPFLGADNSRTELLRTASLVREISPHCYGFTHPSLLEYFLTRNLYEQHLIIDLKPDNPKAEISTSKEDKAKRDYFNQRLLVKESNTIEFLANRVEESEVFKKAMFDWIEASKTTREVSTAAANAITVLNAAKIHFSGMDLRGIQIPNANLEFCILDGTKLSNANLSKTVLRGAWLRKADFSGANLEGIEFGEEPELIHPATVTSCSYSPDGLWLAVASEDKIYIYATKTNKCLHVMETGGIMDFGPDELFRNIEEMQANFWLVDMGPVNQIAFSSDSKYLISGGEDPILRLWEISTGKLIKGFQGLSERINAVAFSSDGKMVAASSDDASIIVWDVEAKKRLHTFNNHTRFSGEGRRDPRSTALDIASGISFDPNGKYLTSVYSQKRYVLFWNLNNSTLEKNLSVAIDMGKDALRCVTYSKDGNYLAAGGNGQIILWRAIEREFDAYVILDAQGRFHSIAFSEDCQYIAGGGGAYNYIWELSTLQIIHQIEGHLSKITSVSWTPDGKKLVSSSENLVKFWEISGQKKIISSLSDEGPIEAIAISPSEGTIASGGFGHNNLIHMWNINTGKLLRSIATEESDIAWSVTDLSFHPKKNWIIGDYAYGVRIWEINTGKQKSRIAFRNITEEWELVSIPSHHKVSWEIGLTTSVVAYMDPYCTNTKSIAMHPNGKTVGIGGKDSNIFLLDIETGTMSAILQAHDKMVICLSFDKEGKKLIAGSVDGTITLWDLDTNRLLLQSSKHKGIFASVGFHPITNVVAAGSTDGTVRIWSIDSPKPKFALKNDSEVSSVSFSNDGNLLASATVNGSVYLWDTSSGKCLASVEHFANRGLNRVCFAQNEMGVVLITGTPDKAVRCWKVQSAGDKYELQLIWTTHQAALVAIDAVFNDNIGFSPDNMRLLQQRGGLIDKQSTSADKRSVEDPETNEDIENVELLPAGTPKRPAPLIFSQSMASPSALENNDVPGQRNRCKCTLV